MSIWGSIVANPLLSEELQFGDIKFRGSLKASTTATFSLTARWLYAEGQCQITDPMYKAGDYIHRPANNIDYFIATVEAEPLANDIRYVYMIGCNAEIDVLRSRGKMPDENGDLKEIWETVCSGVRVYHETVDRSAKTTNDGLIPQAMHNVIIPQSCKISVYDRVVMKTNVDGEFKEQLYRVESISTNLVGREGDGVAQCQMSIDIRN